MRVGLYFGSFNPIHIGHLIVADAVLQAAKLDQIWFIVSPQNPLKKSHELLHEFDRYDLVQRAIASNSQFKVSDIEFHLPKPSYTIDTLDALSHKHPEIEFGLIIGSDNLYTFHKWKSFESILDNYTLYVYPRKKNNEVSTELPWLSDKSRVITVDAPEIDISATYIRSLLKAEKSVKYLLPEGIETYLKLKRFFQ